MTHHRPPQLHGQKYTFRRYGMMNYYTEFISFAGTENIMGMSELNKYVLPIALMSIGAVIVALGIAQGQNNLFLIGGFGIIAVGVISLLGVLEILTKSLQFLMLIILSAISLGLAYLDYKSIKDPIDFIKERDMRYAKVEQRLKDIRQAQIAYKAVHEEYANDFDKLLDFIKNDSFRVVKAIGTVPDTLTEDSAVLLGIVSRDTVLVPVMDSVFSKTYLQDRYSDFNIDSLPRIPYGGGAIFKMDAGRIEKNNVSVPVFMVEDAKPFDPKLVYRVGSMTEPITTGNWE